ncbi:MAG: hypothetical protein R3F46_00950 [bacterium]
MRISAAILLGCLVILGGRSWAADGSVSYKARVVHDERQNISYVDGHVDLASNAYEELVGQSYTFNWRSMPAQMISTRSAMPSIWSDGKRTAQRLADAFPRFDSPLLRHFIVSRVIGDLDELEAGQKYLGDQLQIDSVELAEDSFELIALFRGSPLVVFGKLTHQDGHVLAGDFGVLDAAGELYQYFIDEISYSPQQLAQAPVLPDFDPSRYVEFHGEGEQVPIKPVKDWLVFQARLPNGRPLNLVFDSGAEQMIVDDLVLQLDAGLHPEGNVKVGGALANESMQLYGGFGFEVGGVSFRNMPVIGTQLTSLGYGADMRIHGIVGNEILQLCRLDLDLSKGQMTLNPPGEGGRPSGQELALTFIRDLPHVEADVNNTGPSLLLLDTGQRAPLSMNLDWVEQRELADDLKMNGFLGDVTGGFAPRYILEELDISFAGQDYPARVVDAGYERSFDYRGRQVIGAIGFPLISQHFGGITFDYSQRKLYLRNPGTDLNFTGSEAAWDFESRYTYIADAGSADSGRELAAGDAEPVSSMQEIDPRRPSLLRDGDKRKPRDERESGDWVDRVKAVHDPLNLLRSGQYGSGPARYWNDDEDEAGDEAARIRLDRGPAGQDAEASQQQLTSPGPATGQPDGSENSVNPLQTPLEFRNIDFSTRLQLLRNVRSLFRYMQNTSHMLLQWYPALQQGQTPQRSEFDYSQSRLEFEELK